MSKKIKKMTSMQLFNKCVTDNKLDTKLINHWVSSEELDEAIVIYFTDLKTRIYQYYYDDDSWCYLGYREDQLKEEKSNMELWAEKEIELACKRERNGDEDSDDWDYDCACYESAFKAFKSLMKDGHSGFSISFTKHILNRLVDGQCLTPINDIPENWSDRISNDPEKITYQCNRMSAFFKDVYPDGRIEYHYNDQCYCQSIDDPNNTYRSGLVNEVIREMFPITMPYFPPAKPIKVVCCDFLSNSRCGDYDTVCILYCVKPDGERIEINKYFGENPGHAMVPISKRTYDNRKKKAEELKQQIMEEK